PALLSSPALPLVVCRCSSSLPSLHPFPTRRSSDLNIYLNDVLERRTGIPITLSVVLIETGARLGLGIEGVGFPGHFLVREAQARDRKSTRLNSSHGSTPDAVSAFTKKTHTTPAPHP